MRKRKDALFRSVKVKKYLAMAFGLIIVFTVITTVFGIAALWVTRGNMNELVNRIEVSDKIVTNCNEQANIAGRCVREMALADESQYATYADYSSYRRTGNRPADSNYCQHI